MWDVSDVHNDIKEHLGVVGSSLSRRIRGRGSYQQTWSSANERTSLLPEALLATAKSAPAASFSGYHVGESGKLSSSSECIVGPADIITPDSPTSSSNTINT
jgi:hypothetical protein